MNLQEIKRIPMNDVLSRYGLKPNRAGFIRCPFHNDKTASLKVYRDHWYCFGCGVGGDQIDFTKQMEGISFSEAFKVLGGSPESDSEKIKLRKAEAVERTARDNTLEGLVDIVRRSLADAITVTRMIVQENRPTDPASDYPPAWCEAQNRLPILEFWWELIFIDEAFSWRGGELRGIMDLCRSITAGVQLDRDKRAT